MGAAGNPKMQSHYRYKYTFTQMVWFATINIMDNGGVKDTDYELEDLVTAASGLTLFLVPQVPIQAGAISAVIGGLNSDSDNDSDAVAMAARSAAGKAFRVDNTAAPATWTDVDDVTLQASDYGTGGDIIDCLGFPNPASSGLWTVLMFERSHDWSPGASRVPVADRMNPAYTNIRTRESNEVSVSCDYVTADHATSLPGLRGQTICFIAEARQDGGPIVEEYQILGNFVVNEPTVSAPENGVVTFSASGFYSKVAFFEPA
jgi:hypothetical protein